MVLRHELGHCNGAPADHVGWRDARTVPVRTLKRNPLSAHTLDQEPSASTIFIEDAHTWKFPDALIEYGERRLREMQQGK